MQADTLYAYAVGRIRAIERRLLDKNKIDRMVDAKTPGEALKVLIEADYGYSSKEQANISEYEGLLRDELKKTYNVLAEIAPEPDVFDIFLYKNDFHNIKVLLKSEFLGISDEQLLSETGSVPVNKLKVMLRDRNFKELPETVSDAIIDAIDTFNRTGDPQLIDIILDTACFKLMHETAAASENPFLIRVTEITIDLINIKSFIRIRHLNKSWDFMERVLLIGGTISPQSYFKYLDTPVSKLNDAFRGTSYEALCEEGISEYTEKGSLTRFEKLSDDFMINFLKKAKYIHLGIEPLIAYLIAKETEVKNARIVMIGKINKIESDVIRERLRETYV